MTQLPLRAQLASALGRTAATLSRATGRGDGSVIGGRIGLALEPDLLRKLALDRKLALVSATNGKTTTTRLITSALQELGDVATNAFGANMPAGHVSALSSAKHAPYGVLEVDEKYLPEVINTTGAGVIVLMNLSRDQMDRAGEIWLLAQKWRRALAGKNTHVIANADDPLVTWGASTATRVTWVSAGQPWKEDSWCCPECGGPLDRKGMDYTPPGGHVSGMVPPRTADNDWACRECTFRRPEPSWALDDDAAIDPRRQRWVLDIQLPGRANRANAVMALATAETFGLPVQRALPRLREVRSVAGRYTTVERDGRHARLLLAKNPAGWLEAFDVLDRSLPVILSVNAQGPDGRDTSWLWDVDYRVLRGRPVYVAGERRLDLALRLDVAGVPFQLADSFGQALAAQPPGKVDVIANYTAFQQIRSEFGRAV
ncbi:MurT ligase domain-containing protein [Streptosporangium sp. NBC_01639]|uniref:MurT ligase domain-containing protein n=1 Tax=unclassified Streptosporangium TaxID=2632669 RepID=UPI002DD8AD2B|nr:MurT ligase domain-containing protein [Streptosporangium sp. NBC_01756]WSC83313.1 MurT ligase domain-containing protein [Streptosporangium sp. NBC_01756]WTD58112.1 MurT ligase domain-containing protein [Streptosporangium sp. NBC_01639]